MTQASLRSAISLRRAVLVFDQRHIYFLWKTNASRAEVGAAARAAQAHEFIVEPEDDYDTVVGERGYDLSVDNVNAYPWRDCFCDPSVIISDDSTSAIDVEIEGESTAP